MIQSMIGNGFRNSRFLVLRYGFFPAYAVNPMSDLKSLLCLELAVFIHLAAAFARSANFHGGDELSGEPKASVTIPILHEYL